MSRLCTRLGNISTHTPLAGRDESLANMSRNSCNFYSHAPRGARQPRKEHRQGPQQFLLTRPSRGATRVHSSRQGSSRISTHTPLAGRDGRFVMGLFVHVDFYSHAPRGARLVVRHVSGQHAYFYSHAPRGARPATDTADQIGRFISTHTPLAGRDSHRPSGRSLDLLFLLTRPSRGATGCYDPSLSLPDFYSHAPRGARP